MWRAKRNGDEPDQLWQSRPFGAMKSVWPARGGGGGGGGGGAKSLGPGLNGARAFRATPFISH